MDRRTIKTKKAIKEAFLSQLKNKDLNNITVTKITKIANIGRNTFYLHYLDIADLYEKITEELFYEMEYFFDNAYPTTNPENLKTLIEKIINFISKNKEIFLIMLKLEGNEKTISKLKNVFNKKIFLESIKILSKDDVDTKYLNIETNFIVSGIVGVIDKWLNEGLTLQNDEITGILHKIIMKFNQ